jgi:hypothetical protein
LLSLFFLIFWYYCGVSFQCQNVKAMQNDPHILFELSFMFFIHVKLGLIF